MKKYTALFMAIAFLGLNCTSLQRWKGMDFEPGRLPGAKVVIQKKDGQKERGELISVKDSSLLLFSESGVDSAIGVESIQTIILVKKSKVFVVRWFRTLLLIS